MNKYYDWFSYKYDRADDSWYSANKSKWEQKEDEKRHETIAIEKEMKPSKQKCSMHH